MLILALTLLGFDPPLITEIRPAGVTVGTKQVWTITGRNLDRVNAIRTTGSGLTAGPVAVDPAGRSLVVAVAADPTALADYREVRVDGPDGISNLLPIRVDTLPQVVEVEPNDRTPAPGQIIAAETAVAGTLLPLDVDCFRVEGRPGEAVTLDWETRRLGTAIIPVMTLTGPGGVAIAQVRSAPGGDRDCRCAVVVPPEGWFTVELRDNTYDGDERARYRLRVDRAPLASAGPVPSPGRLHLADPDHAETSEPPDRAGAATWPTPLAAGGATITGRLAQPGEVDRFRIEAKAGDRFRAEVHAAPWGSWLDSVLTVRDAQGRRLGENDDPPPAPLIVPPTTIDGAPCPDAVVDLVVAADGPLTVELADRFGMGGPEYHYRLTLGPPADDFAVGLLPSPTSADPTLATRVLTDPAAPVPPSAGWSGAFNLTPGTTTAVPFVVAPRGRPGTVEVRAVDLPAGVTSEPVVVRLARAPRSGRPGDAAFDAPPVVDSFTLRVAADAAPVRGNFRVEARRRGTAPPASERAALAVVGVDAAGGPSRPVVRTLTSFPIRILGPGPR